MFVNDINEVTIKWPSKKANNLKTCPVSFHQAQIGLYINNEENILTFDTLKCHALSNMS